MSWQVPIIINAFVFSPLKHQIMETISINGNEKQWNVWKVFSKKFPQDEVIDALQCEGVSSSLVISSRVNIGARALHIDLTWKFETLFYGSLFELCCLKGYVKQVSWCSPIGLSNHLAKRMQIE